MIEDLYKSLLAKVSEGSQCVMLTYLNFHCSTNGTIAEKILLTKEEIDKNALSMNEKLYDSIHMSLNTGKLQIINSNESQAIVIEPFIPKPRLIIFGGGHIAKPLTEFAVRVGFSVNIIDDRPSFANVGRFPEAEKVICEDFEKCFDLINLRESDYVVIITRGHRHDGLVLRKVLDYDLNYIGMIGSKRRVKGMMEELLKEGFPKDMLDSVNSPIGLDIGAITPDEIAVSIVSQLISYKNRRKTNEFGESFIMPEFDAEVACKVSEKSSIPKALITILSSKGSVPRKAGAKMIAYLDGRTLGSIGGGCSESEVITKARSIMREKGFLIQHVDMTGDVAESEGMVCGGTMEVLVEVF